MQSEGSSRSRAACAQPPCVRAGRAPPGFSVSPRRREWFRGCVPDARFTPEASIASPPGRPEKVESAESGSAQKSRRARMTWPSSKFHAQFRLQVRLILSYIEFGLNKSDINPGIEP